MPKYYGCPCEGCGRPLALTDDIVVCPDCGAPYHRTCYEKMGLCVHAPAHGAGYEWKFPYQDAQLRTCPTCGERTLRSESVCRCCGAALPPESAEQPNDRAAASADACPSKVSGASCEARRFNSPLNNAASVPGFSARCKSAISQVAVLRGSITTTFISGLCALAAARR